MNQGGNCRTTPTMASAVRNDWWMQSVVRRALPSVQEDLHHVISQSPFLQQSQPAAHIGLFHRSEIITGARLGEGGFSEVFEIVAFELNPQYSQMLTLAQQQVREFYQQQTAMRQGRYAIKHLQQQLLNDPKSFQCAASDMAVEAAYMSSLDHANILSVRGLPVHGLESFSEGRHDSYFIILDRLEDTLDRRIEQWKTQDMPVLGKAGYALQLAQALEHLHQRGILFRDLKPANIGFTADGTLQLLDFGLCREMPASNIPNAVFEMSGVGTRRYMAVEIVNTACYNDKADVYSWSMVFWEMLSLCKPYPTYSVDDHKRMVCQGGERPPLQHKQWPLPIQNLLMSAWSTSIPDRLSMKEVECLLRSYIECCKVLDETPESPTAVCDRSLLQEAVSNLQFLDLPMADDEDDYYYNGEPDLYPVAFHNNNINSNEANLLRDHRMSVTLQDFSQNSVTEDMFALEQTSVYGAPGCAGTDVSSYASDFGLESVSCASSCFMGGGKGLGRISNF